MTIRLLLLCILVASCHADPNVGKVIEVHNEGTGALQSHHTAIIVTSTTRYQIECDDNHEVSLACFRVKAGDHYRIKLDDDSMVFEGQPKDSLVWTIKSEKAR